MTAVNVIRTADAVHVLTDGASFGRDGTIAHIGPKAWPLPHLDAVIATRGVAGAAAQLVHALGARRGLTFGGLRQAIPEVMKGLADRNRAEWERSASKGGVAVFVAGFDNGRPSSFVVECYADAVFRPWEAEDLPPVATAPTSNVTEAIVRERGHRLDPVEDGLRLMEAQRAIPTPEMQDRSAVGGFAQLTTVRRDGIATRILKHWPDDAIGWPIRHSEHP